MPWFPIQNKMCVCVCDAQTGVTAAQWKYAGSGITAGSLVHWNVCRLIFHKSSRINSPL